MPFYFDPQQEYILEDDRVILRPLQVDDAPNLMHFALHEPETWTYSNLTAAGEQGMRKYVTDAVEARATGKEYPFIVFEKQTQQYAGSTRFYDIQPANLTLQLGYTWYGSAFCGTGLNKHCKYLLLNFAFEKVGAIRVEFRADNANKRSVAAMKSIGCTVEGILRSHSLKRDGNRRDTIILSILKSEWESGIKERLKEKLQ